MIIFKILSKNNVYIKLSFGTLLIKPNRFLEMNININGNIKKQKELIRIT
ncbi:MAG: hypothetical protein CH6_1167 [Candidatus Kapaibacterium sp.]|nr:MAG: hypothetical protein CH6_1167 [Candidatus Kapabacteria bacterium]